ncbi:MAG: NAD(P)-dependent oxidoreductase [Deltaproteobacteria bacterium]|nr:NAD(P)-dependent oxidoreductase [Deltaproteobacteria bacterium]
MAILITGGTGFLGRHLTRHLLQSGEKDLVLLDSTPNLAAIADVAAQVKVVPGDVLEPTALIDTIKKYNIEGIIHLAYFLGTGGIRNPLPSIRINCIGTTNVFEVARFTGITRVVYMSSVAVYPMRTTLTGPALSEDDPPAPDSVYGACKLFNEHIANYYAQAYGLDPVGIRPTSVFGMGRGQRRGVEPDHFMVLPELALLGQPVVMPPDEQISDWMYVADAAEVFTRAYRVKNPKHRIFNMSGECRRTGEVTAYLRAILPQAKISVSDKPFAMTSLVKTDRLRTELGFTPKYTVEEGILAYLNDVRRREGLPLEPR